MTIDMIIEQIAGKRIIRDDCKRAEWLSWYEGKVKRFHRYTIFNGKKRVPMERMTLGMPKKMCEDWANLLLNEKTDIVLGDESSQAVLNEILAKNHFWKKGNGAVEKYMALGMGAIVEGVKNIEFNENGDAITNGEVIIQFINGTKIYPLAFENDKITECGFVNMNPKKALVSVHKLNEYGEYEIINCVCDQDKGFEYKFDPNSVTIFNTHSKTPWFQILKPNIENNIDVNSPLGISVFANAIDILRSVDLTYDSMYNELNLGRKRIFIASRQLKTDMTTGEQVQVFDQNDVEYYVLPESDDGKTIINDNTQQLRIDAIDQALQRQINLLCAKCGFGVNYIRLRPGGETTATQVISENSEMFRSLRKHEIVLEEALVDMVKAITEITNTYTTQHIAEDTEVQVKFDDSVIEDKESEKASDRLDLANGVISRAEYRAKWFAEDLDTAEQQIKDIARQNNTQIMTDLASMSSYVSKETLLELNPYIDDVEAEKRRLEEESVNSISLLTEEELRGVVDGSTQGD